MKEIKNISRSRAQESSAAIEKMYITMRHLFNRGFYKPMGVSGDTLREALLTLRPEIYGNIAEEKVELSGLLYVIERLPIGIEECRFINLTSDEGYSKSHFQAIVPPKRRRNCYRIDEEQMNVEITRGRSDIYDILTHLTFIFIESHKIRNRVLLDDAGEVSRDWQKLEQAVLSNKKLTLVDKEKAISHAANILGRTFAEILDIYDAFGTADKPDRFLHVVYWLGKLALEEVIENKKNASFEGTIDENTNSITGKWINATNNKELIFNLNLSSRSGETLENRYFSGILTEAVELFMKKTKESIIKKQKDWLSQNIKYPISVTVFNKRIKIKNQKEFLAKYAAIFSEKFFNEIKKSCSCDIFSNDEGAMFADGLIWVNEFNGHLKITTINN